MSHVDALSRVVALIDALPLEMELEFRQLKDPRFYVPESMVSNVIRIYHDKMAHCGMEKTLQGISCNYWFPSLRKRVRSHIDNCIICLLANSASNSCEGEMQITENPAFPFQIIHMDHFGPIVESEHGFKHIFVVVEAFTRFTWLYQKLIDESQGWHDCLGTVQYVINNTFHSSLKASSSKLLLGYEQRNHADSSLVNCLKKISGFNLSSRPYNSILSSDRIKPYIKPVVKT